MANPQCWSRSLGPRRGARVRVYEREPGGTLYVSIWKPEEGERRTSLGHRDKRRGPRGAGGVLELRQQTAQDRATAPPPVGGPFRRYTTGGRYLPGGCFEK